MERGLRKKLGVIFSVEDSHWNSCGSISRNLRSAYQHLAKKRGIRVDWIPVSERSAREDLSTGTGYLWDIADGIYKSGVSDLVFLDHHIDKLVLVSTLKAAAAPSRFKKLSFLFHIYGDFTVYPKQWMALGDLLNGSPVKLLCASERQRNLVRFFESRGQGIKTATSVCPFPVNTSFFRFSPVRRKTARKKLGLSERQTLLLYTGRISLQKGVLRLIQAFGQLLQEDRRDLFLAIAGPIDDIGKSSALMPQGYLYQKLQAVLASLPENVRKRVLLLGQRPLEELKELYSAADLFTSLSLFHDEDFGMAPAEALISGLPTVLTDWGGYASFAVPGARCSLVPVELGKPGLSVDGNALMSMLRQQLSKRASEAERKQAGRCFAKRFSIPGVADRLERELRAVRRFSGFNQRLQEFTHSAVLNQNLYREVYGRYTRST